MRQKQIITFLLLAVLCGLTVVVFMNVRLAEELWLPNAYGTGAGGGPMDTHDSIARLHQEADLWKNRYEKLLAQTRKSADNGNTPPVGGERTAGREDPKAVAAFADKEGVDHYAGEGVTASELRLLKRISRIADQHQKSVTWTLDRWKTTLPPKASDIELYQFMSQNLHDTLHHLIEEYRNTGRIKKAHEAHYHLANYRVQRQLEELQHPSDCNNARLLTCNINKSCGFGCQIHHTIYCFSVAYASNRTLLLDSSRWGYTSGGYESLFLPVSSCPITSETSSGNSNSFSDDRVVQLSIIEQARPLPAQIPPTVPPDLLELVETFHGSPAVWWVGQLMKYLMRPNENLQNYIQERKDRFKWEHPVVGVHVRRTDKIGTEAQYHDIDEYMRYVQEFFYTRYPLAPKKSVYLASDEPKVLQEAKIKYPNFEFYTDEATANAAQKHRYSDNGLIGVVADIIHLSECDYIVCTFSSQVCRVAFELMQTLHVDASWKFVSLDDPWYYGGGTREKLKVWMDYFPEHHTEKYGKLMEIQKGDVIEGITKWFDDGFLWKGKNLRTKEEGFYPAYSVESFTLANTAFPKYPKYNLTATT